MSIAVIVATYGDCEWSERATMDAVPSAIYAGFNTVLHVHLENSTLATARNHAARSVTANWLCFLDADDRLDDGYADALAPHLNYQSVGRGQRPEAKLLTPQMERMGMYGTYFPNREAPMTELNHCVIGTVVPRWLFEKAGGFRELPVYEDWDLWLRCIRLGAVIEDVPGAVYVANLGSGRNSPAQPIRQSTYEQIKREHKEALNVRPQKEKEDLVT